jgi:micrococcal nuclease
MSRIRKVSRFLVPVLLVLILSVGAAEKDVHRVASVIDGDTIKLENGERVRYIGIDTPETKHPSKPVEYFGREADRANRALVEGKEVRLEFDVQQRDKYGRLLAYVYVGDIFVNAWLVENRYAKVLTIPPNVRYAERFLELQRRAREEGRGSGEKEVRLLAGRQAATQLLSS